MTSRNRLGTSISTIAVAAALSGCAIGQQHSESIFGQKVDHENIGVATRALAELNSGNVAAAVSLAEQAVANTPNDAGFRALLGNCYFAAGRFASAEQAYRDSLTLLPVQPKLILKLALVEIAQGKDSQALALLDDARNALDPSDYGLAVALAGQPQAAVEVLNEAARAPGADARVRQNLALAYGLSGDWTMARTVAAQDVPPEQLDSRVQQWMAMATPAHPSDQVAALTGVHPVADPGQPARLALNSLPGNEAVAQADIVPARPQSAQQQPQLPAQPQAVSVLRPISVVSASPVAADSAPKLDIPEQAVAEATQSLIQAPPAPVAKMTQTAAPAIADAAPVVPAAAPKPVADLPTRFDAKPDPASYIAISDEVRRAAEKAQRAEGNSGSVVQLGAYSSPERVNIAWQQLTKRHPALAHYTPVRAKFQSANGTVWRLSIKGFASQKEAIDRCELLQSRGGACFVRQVAGDAPVQFAAR